MSQNNVQIGGKHYKEMKHQPLEVVLDNLGYEAFKGACITKLLKYIMRDKGESLEDLKKALHVLHWLVEVTEVNEEKVAQSIREFRNEANN